MLFCFVTTIISFTPKSRECIFCFLRMSILVQSRIENPSKFCHANASRGIILVPLLLRLPELLVLGRHGLIFSKWYRR